MKKLIPVFMLFAIAFSTIAQAQMPTFSEANIKCVRLKWNTATQDQNIKFAVGAERYEFDMISTGADNAVKEINLTVSTLTPNEFRKVHIVEITPGSYNVFIRYYSNWQEKIGWQERSIVNSGNWDKVTALVGHDLQNIMAQPEPLTVTVPGSTQANQRTY